MGDPIGTTRVAVDLDSGSDERLERIARELARSTGPLPTSRGRRLPTRVDVLRATLVVLEEDRGVLAAVRGELLHDALAPVAGNEIRGLAVEIGHGAPWMGTSEAQHAAIEIGDELDAFSRSPLFSDGATASAELARQALRVAELATTAGTDEGLRPLLDIARRLEVVRDAIDPAEKDVCRHCARDVRTGHDGLGTEPHTTGTGELCSRVANS